jgi:anti-sigma regulatory factor (Ser/Thr protein kinase)
VSADAPARCVVTEDVARFAARAMVRAFALRLGFTREVVEELVLVTSELASNILKYGRRGAIEVAATTAPDRAGIVIAAEDETPPFDLTNSIRDGYDVHGKLDPARVYGRSGIGAGLGAIARLTDALEIVPHGSGKRIIVKRYFTRARRGSSPAL